MTLLIACLIIYGLDLDPWLYAAAAVLWLVRTSMLTKWMLHVAKVPARGQ